ncbi:MAG: hypothetical protein WAW37_09165 [Syntrophobacteraceae bacterium]
MICILFGVGPAFGAIDIPAKLKDIPLYKGSKIQHAMDMETNAMVTATVKEKPETVADFYKNTMKGKGWKVVFQAQQETTQMIHFQKDKQLLHITVQGGEGEEATTYNLVISSQ